MSNSPQHDRARSKLLYHLNICVCIALSGLVLGSSARADSPPSREQKIKAALIYYIAKFVEWPASTLHSPLRVCVLSSDSMYTAVHETLRDKVSGKKSFEVSRLSGQGYMSEIAACNIVFVGSDQQELRPQVSQTIGASPTLSICEVTKVSWGNCIIQVFEQDNRARLAVDPELAVRSRLKISSELLELAQVKN